MKSDTFCILPFKGLYVRPDGKISPCCVSKEIKSNKNFNKNTIKDSFNSDEMKDIRIKLLNGEKPHQCKSCWDRESNGVSSYRHDWNDKLGTDVIVEKDGYVEPNFEYIDVRLSNLCNFKCIMCGYEYSSSHYTEVHKQQGLPKVLNIRENFIEELKPYIKNLKYVYFAGGEPLISKEHFELLNYLNDVNRNISISYNTNLSTIKYDVTDLTTIWKNFKRVDIQISLDGLYERGEMIRKGLKTQTIIDNIFLLQKNNINYSISYTVGSYNINYIYEFLNQLKSLKLIYNEDMVSFNNYVQGNENYSLSDMNVSDKNKSIDYLKKGIDYLETDTLRNQINDLINFIKPNLI